MHEIFTVHFMLVLLAKEIPYLSKLKIVCGDGVQKHIFLIAASKNKLESRNNGSILK